MPHQSRSQFLTLLESVAVGGCDGPIFSERKRVGVVAAGGPATPGKAKRKEPLGSWACNPPIYQGFWPIEGNSLCLDTPLWLACIGSGTSRAHRKILPRLSPTLSAFARSGSRGLSRETWADDFVRPARSQSKITRGTASHSKRRQLPAQPDINEYEVRNRFRVRYRSAKLRDTRPTELAHRWRSSAWNVFPFIYTNQKTIRSGKNLICAQRGDRMVVPSEGS